MHINRQRATSEYFPCLAGALQPRQRSLADVDALLLRKCGCYADDHISELATGIEVGFLIASPRHAPSIESREIVQRLSDAFAAEPVQLPEAAGYGRQVPVRQRARRVPSSVF